MRGSSSAAAVLAVLVIGAGCARLGPPGADLVPDTVLGRYDWQAPAAHWPLPDHLEEASGLAWVGGALVSHQDNDALLWRIDVSPGEPPVVTMLPGQTLPPIDGDFEGIAVQDDAVYLLGSPGVLLRGHLNPERSGLRAGLSPVTTGVESRCNFEGLAPAPESGRLFVVCKYPRDPRPGEILLYVIEPNGTAASRALRVDVTPVLGATGLERLRPSGLVWLPEPARLLVLVGKEHVILELDADGRLLAWRRLPRRFHRQAEGVAGTPDGAIVIVDEADNRRPTLSVYGALQAADE